jgi:hypothetical protein
LRKPIQIGNIGFATKKAALNHYKEILNSYDYEESLSPKDFGDILNLLETHPQVKDKIGIGIEKVKVVKLKYNTKSFELVRIDGSKEYFSYTKRINAPKTDFAKFRDVCRKTIQEDLRKVKLSYFEKHSKSGKVKCQKTGELLKWEDLSVDHRQPNTFSVIVDRFVELKNLDVKLIEYLKINGDQDEFVDEKLKSEFKSYHKEKANLRIISKTLNLGRSFQARVNRQKKDLRI